MLDWRERNLVRQIHFSVDPLIQNLDSNLQEDELLLLQQADKICVSHRKPLSLSYSVGGSTCKLSAA